jgi:PTS system mannose-specific IIB component/fructoselysine and glucoselysine-specific PTS system IIB component
VALEVFRIDDRLIHGQVVVGWGQPLELGFILLVDDEVAGSEWEQELYRMGVPPEMSVYFETIEGALERFAHYAAMPQPGLLLTGDIYTMGRLVTGGAAITTVNLGGLHHRAGRVPRLRYVFLTPDEESALSAMAARGVVITAQDVPASAPVPLPEILEGHGE